MKLKLRDLEAERNRVEETEFLDLLEIAVHPNNDDEDPLYQWVRPTHLDDDGGNPDPRVITRARDYGINVEKVLEEEVGVNVVASGSSNATADSSSVDKSSNDGSDGGGGNVGEYEYNSPSPLPLSPFTGK